MSGTKFSKPKYIICAPCFNESEGIAQYVKEIRKYISDSLIIIVDDCSTDATLEQLLILQKEIDNLMVLANKVNVGHGMSSMRAWSEAIRFESEGIISLDGDGQIAGVEIATALDYFKKSNTEVLECVRTQRRDPWFRKLITAALKLLVLVKSGKYPKDANTPVRIYKKDILSEIVRLVPENSLTPNLFISIHIRKNKTKYSDFRIITRDRLGDNRVGTTWNTKRSLMPSKKLLQFCAMAIKQIYKM